MPNEAPWRLVGNFIGMVGLVPVKVALRHVPDSMSVIRVLPGYTLGAIFVGMYNESSAGPYAEMGIVPSLVRARGSRAMWLSHLFVNEEAPRVAGSEIWGIPKDEAAITWSTEPDTDGRARTEVLIERDGKEIVHWAVTQQPIPLPGRYHLPMASLLGDRILKWSTEVRSKVHKVHSELWLDDELAPLRPLPSTAFGGALESAVLTAPI